MLRHGADALIALEGSVNERGIMEAGEEREVIHRISADRVVEVNEGSDLIAGAEDVPKCEIFVHEAALREIEQGAVVSDLGKNVIRARQETARLQKVQMLFETKVEVVGVARSIASQLLIKHSKAFERDRLPLRHRHADLERDLRHLQRSLLEPLIQVRCLNPLQSLPRERNAAS